MPKSLKFYYLALYKKAYQPRSIIIPSPVFYTHRDPQIPYTASFSNNFPSWPYASYGAHVKLHFYCTYAVPPQIGFYTFNAGMYDLEN